VDLRLKGKVVVVTGASRGIGLAVARAFLDEGAHVVAGARNPGPALEALAASHGLVPVAGDLATVEGVEGLVGAAVERFGTIDVLVNNVGTAAFRPGGSLSVTDEEWLDTLNLNLFSAVRASRAALPSLLVSRGVIVTISSIHAALPEPALVDYGASKSALTSFVKALAKEVSPQGVRVNTVSLGPVPTDMLEHQIERITDAIGVTRQAAIEQYTAGIGGIPTGRFTRPDEVADLVVILASDRTDNITGADITLDGGLIKTL
jgi:NAD(P)-dependent dehydrogenase (short-subunit alcohol dehydrogenase family)